MGTVLYRGRCARVAVVACAGAQGRRGRYRGIHVGNRLDDSTRRFLGYLWWFEIHVMAKNVLHRQTHALCRGSFWVVFQ